MRNVLLLLLTVLCSLGALSANNKSGMAPQTPDFAFPETVVTDAEASLKKSMATRNYLNAIRSCIEFTVAENMVDRANVGLTLDRIDSLALQMPAEYASLVKLLEAQVYADYYRTNAGVFNGRALPLDDYPKNVADWSQSLFAKKISELVKEALNTLGDSDGLSLKSLEPVLTSTEAADFIPDESDFIVYKGVDLLSGFPSLAGGSIPFRAADSPAYTAKSPAQVAADLVDVLVKSRLQKYADGSHPGPLAYAMTRQTLLLSGESRLEWIRESISKLEGKPESIMMINQLATFDSPGDFLQTDSVDSAAIKKASDFYTMAESALKCWPDAYGAGRLSNTVGAMTSPVLRVSSSGQFAPSTPVRLSVTLCNSPKINILLLSLPDAAEYRGKKVSQLISSARLVKSVELATGMSVPGRVDTVVDLGTVPCGLYLAVPSTTSDLRGIPASVREKRPTAFRVSSMRVITAGVNGIGQQRKVYVVDAVSGKPMEGVKVEFRTYEKGRLKTKATALTGREGDVDADRGSWGLRLTKGKDVQYANAYLYTAGEEKAERRLAAEIMNDLSVYHPGDSAACVAVCYFTQGHALQVAPSEEVTLNLRDANNVIVSTHVGTTDAYGRVTAGFRIPESGLLGAWRFEAIASGSAIGNGYFEVADYKTPTFYVEIDSVSPVSEAGEKVVIKGKACTYTGMPVAGAEVRYDIRYASWWCWRGSQSPDATFAGVTGTDADGNFLIELDTRLLKDTPYAFGAYRLNVSVTSSAGETQQSPSATFALGSVYRITPDIPAMVDASSASGEVSVRVTDILGLPVSKRVDYTVFDSKSVEVVSGSFTAPKLALDFGKLPSGSYEARFRVSDADTVASNSVKFIVWRPSDRIPPVETHLWSPVKSIMALAGKSEVEIPVGSSYKDSHILCYITGSDGTVKAKWLNLDSRNSVVKVKAPSGNERLWLTLATVADLGSWEAKVEILPAGSDRKVDIVTESFRDKLTPGDKERWRFRFTYGGKSQPFMPVMAVMSDKAINAIAPFRWNFAPVSQGWNNPLAIDLNYGWMASNSFTLATFKHSSEKEIILPGWQTYGYSLVPYSYMNRRMHIRGVAVTNGVATEEEVAVDEAKYYSAPAMMKSASDFGVAKESLAMGADSDSAGEGLEQKEEIPLRDMECPLAFFMPMLQTDGEGLQTLEFTVPDFNTTWQLQLLGYTSSLESSIATLEATASKPVMVSTNPPRFLRTGDQASISATLYNATDSIADVWGKIEVLDPMTGLVMGVLESPGMALSPSGSRVITLNFAVPDSIGTLLVKAYAGNSRHTDGEQMLIPVLPSSTPVTESTAFYLDPSEKDFSLTLPDYASNALVTLQYCDNPIWYCVTALPSVTMPESKNLLSILRAYYGDATAKGIVDKYPAVAEGIRRLASSGLQSALSMNSDLKSVELLNTPWLNDAASETSRMRGLSTLLDNVEPTLSRLLGEIKALQNADGGWSWCPGMKSSAYMTSNVLLHFGMLAKNGWLPASAEMDRAIKAGKEYLDISTLASYTQAKKRISVSQAVEWLYVRGFFSGNTASAEVKALRRKAVDLVKSEWRSLPLYARARAAIVLHREGLASDASNILESLRQTAVYTPALGMRYENLPSGYGGYSSLFTTAQVLEAFAEIDPSSPCVDRLRQGLIIQRETENWGANTYTVDVVQAILGSGADWIQSSNAPEITLDGKIVDLPSIDDPIGYCRVTLPVSSASGKILRISKGGEGPAWGSVMSQYVSPITDVKAGAMPEISISKNVYLVTDGEASPVSDSRVLKVGDKVRVTLVLTTTRDMDYVAVTDARSACLEPAIQLSGYTCIDGLWLYREVRDDATNFFIGFLPKGSHVISYDCFVDRQGGYTLGIAEAQSQYAPQIVAHSGGDLLTIKAAQK